MEEQLINFETAKLAKEKKFDVQCIHGFAEDISDSLSKGISEEFYWELGDRPDDNYFENLLNYDQEDLFYYSRPSQSLLQKWLREKHNIHVDITTTVVIGSNDEVFYRVSIIEGNLDNTFHPLWDIESDVYEKTLEKGLFEALKLI